MSEYEYDTVDGHLLANSLKGRSVPAAPRWVRERSTLAKRYSFATLSKELLEWYGPVQHSMAVDYVKKYQKYHPSFLVTFPAHEWRVQNDFLAAGILNEILFRYGNVTDVSVSWLSAYGGVSYLLDMRDSGRWDEYTTYRNKLFSSGLLWIQGLEGARYREESRWFLHMVYQHRQDNLLPTITTASLDSWKELIHIFGRTFVTKLYETSEDYRLVGI
jgi:hypothetical protein